MAAEAVLVVKPLTRATLAVQGPTDRCLSSAKVMFPDWPGARAMICWAGNDPALMPPEPPARPAVPFGSTARPPVLGTWARISDWPLADWCPVMEVMANVVGGAPPWPTAR